MIPVRTKHGLHRIVYEMNLGKRCAAVFNDEDRAKEAFQHMLDMLSEEFITKASSRDLYIEGTHGSNVIFLSDPYKLRGIRLPVIWTDDGLSEEDKQFINTRRL